MSSDNERDLVAWFKNTLELNTREMLERITAAQPLELAAMLREACQSVQNLQIKRSVLTIEIDALKAENHRLEAEVQELKAAYNTAETTAWNLWG